MTSSFLRRFFWFQVCAAVFMAAAFGAWVAYPSAYFIRPLSLEYQYETDTFIFARHVRDTWAASERKLGDEPEQRGYYIQRSSEIIVTRDTPLQCQEGEIVRAFMQITESDIVEVPPADWLRKCVDAGPPFYIITTRQVFLWRWLPLWPLETVVRIDPEKIIDPAIE